MNDGTPLVSDAAPSSLDKTLMAGSLGAPPQPPSQSYSPGAPQGDWATPSWPPNPTWQQPGVAGATAAPKKSKLPWILGGVAVLLLGLIGIGGAAAFFLLRGSSEESSNTRRGLGFNINKNDKEANTNSSSTTTSSNANTSEHSHDNMNSGSSSSGEMPTDKEVVTKQLYDLEYAWCAADLKGDKAAMDRLLASEFVVTNPDGTTMNKKQYLAQMKPDEYNRTCTYSDFSLGQSANYAVIIGYNTVKGRTADGPFTERSKFTDTFVWRDGRWQATASKSEVLK
jgi:hypothetical protein